MHQKEVLSMVRKNLHTGQVLQHGLSTEDWHLLLDTYSSFIDHYDSNGFLIDSQVEVTNPYTPRPCLHLMASNHSNEYGVWGSFWDQFGGGFCFLDSALAGRMSSHLDTNYVPTSPELQDVRRFFIHENGLSWPMLPIPHYEPDQYTNFNCTQGLDRHLIRVEREKLASELEVCVHPELPLELWTLRITNLDSVQRSFSWFTSTRVNIDSFPSYYFVPRVVCEGIIEDNSLVFINHDKKNKHPRHVFFTSCPNFDHFDMMGEIFDGIGGRAPVPHAVQNGHCSNSLGKQPYAGLVAAAQFNVTLKPGESKLWNCAYGTCSSDSEERKSFLRYIRLSILSEHDKIKLLIQNGWNRKTQAFMIKTPVTEIDRYFNVWSKYQNRSQTRFYTGTDKIGYRDMLQNLLGICDCDLTYVRKSILRLLQYQLEDGRAIRQYGKIQGTDHDFRMYMDSSSWIPDTLVKYVQESGDRDVLEELVPFLDIQTSLPNKDSCATVYEHALRAVRCLNQNTGYHGLCRIGYGDWNDALSGIGGKMGISVWLSCACVYAAGKMAQLADYLGRVKDADEMRLIAQIMTKRINDHAWDGEWYIYAINENGMPIGSAKNTEGKIHLNVNTWALFTGVAQAAGREEQVLNAIRQLATPVGHKLLTPPYTSISRNDVGRIADQQPGLIENGSIYTHGEAFYLYALAILGRTDQCLAELTRVLPSNLVQDISTAPRQQQSNFTVGPDHPDFGSQYFSNFTGSVPWFRRVIEYMLGVYPYFDSLVIKPIVPNSWNTYEVVKVWRNRKIRVYFQRSKIGKQRIILKEQVFENLIPFSALEATSLNEVHVDFVK